ncbi:MAG: Mut7-C RNAse domain-containing protein [Dehalococcoidales bacterium]|nr:Mut7-C RNAse domain-containing protein [Dehalococcoidales bacterium]
MPPYRQTWVILLRWLTRDCRLTSRWRSVTELKFIVDQNVGKLTRWLRTMGYDTEFFTGTNDNYLVRQALEEDRIILTRDTEIMKRRAITTGRVRAVLLTGDESEEQMRQVITALKLDSRYRPFTICLECNRPLAGRSIEEVKDRVPPYVFKTQRQYMECPNCRRIYWRGTHWQAMMKQLEKFSGDMQ